MESGCNWFRTLSEILRNGLLVELKKGLGVQLSLRVDIRVRKEGLVPHRTILCGLSPSNCRGRCRIFRRIMIWCIIFFEEVHFLILDLCLLVVIRFDRQRYFVAVGFVVVGRLEVVVRSGSSHDLPLISGWRVCLLCG